MVYKCSPITGQTSTSDSMYSVNTVHTLFPGRYAIIVPNAMTRPILSVYCHSGMPLESHRMPLEATFPAIVSQSGRGENVATERYTIVR